ncbi:MAG: hypothetical protein AAB382_00160 [Chloroflexota bacterium]
MTNDMPQFEEPGPAEIPPAQESQIETKLAAAKPALTIVVQSWSTPIVGIVMLVLGLLIGYFGRPVVADRIAAFRPTATSEPTPAAVVGPQAQPRSREELMEYLISQTRHFRGNPEASIVMIEFSDFQ